MVGALSTRAEDEFKKLGTMNAEDGSLKSENGYTEKSDSELNKSIDLSKPEEQPACGTC